MTCTAGPFTYTGTAQEPCTATVTGANGLNDSVTVSYTNNTNAGTATASATYAETANYLGSNDSETFTIGKAATTTTVTCPEGPYTYSGSAQTPCSASVTGPMLNSSLTVSYANNVHAGIATASATFAGDANHNGDTGTDDFTIDKAASVTTITCPASVTYDGDVQEPCSAAATGAGGLNESVTVDYTDNTNAGTAGASASYAGDANHNGSTDTESFTIAKAPTTTVVTCPTSVEYNGGPHNPCTAEVTGPGLAQSLSVAYTGNTTNPGVVTASASYAGNANLLASSDTETFTITVRTCAYTATFLAPIKDGVRNIVKLNNVIPVKLRITDCNGVVVTDERLAIRVVGNILDANDIEDGSEVIPTSVSGADTTGVMRTVDSHYMYNMSTKGLKDGFPYTIIISEINDDGTLGPRVQTAVIQPKK